jgi:DNA-directed RNA polymerase subunit omega
MRLPWRETLKQNRCGQEFVTLGDVLLSEPVHLNPMQKRTPLETTNLMRRAEELVDAASNRYRITVQVANRAKRRRYEDFDNLDEPGMKPVVRAIVEMSDELTQPEIIGD